MESITICSYNVGGWTDGTRQGMNEDELPQRLEGWRSFLSDLNPDFLLCEEASLYLDAARTLDPYRELFSRYYPYSARPETGHRLTDEVLLLGKYPIENMTVESFESGSGRPFVSFRTEVNGRRLNIAVVHLSIEADSEGIRQKDLSELAEMLSEGKLDIITGDFNTFAIGEFDVFRPVSRLANHGDSGDFETWPHTAGRWNRCIDNIIVRNEYSLGDVRSGSAVLSDHMPLTAKIGL